MKKTNIHKSDELWRKHEPNARVTRKEYISNTKSMKESDEMRKRSVQTVKVYPHKVAFGLVIPKRFKSFSVVVSIPLKSEDIYARMQLAFPNCEWRGEQ